MTVTSASESLEAMMHGIGRNARRASLQLASVPTGQKDAFLEDLADRLVAETDSLLAANARDLDEARRNGLAAQPLERLTFNPERIAAMAQGVREVAALPDPVGEVLETSTRPNGLILRKVRVPIGVIGIIYESRPNVTVDCAVLCLKSGNAAILRGGSEAFHTNSALAHLITESLTATGLPRDTVQFVPTTDRAALNHLLRMDDCVHCIIPRGGEALIRFVAEHSLVPVIKHFNGICNVYLDAAADPALAVSITVNAKTQRPSVCNAAENLFVDRAAAGKLLPPVARALVEQGVELRADPDAGAILAAEGIPCVPATDEDFATEYLALVIAIGLVDGVEGAIDAINRYGSQHSEAIITQDDATARRFFAGVDSAALFWNASTRFNDGFEFGLGAEIGISTDRLHARGPMGLRELCTYKYLVSGTGQVK